MRQAGGCALRRSGSPGRRTRGRWRAPARRAASALENAVSAATWNRSGWRASTRSAVVPIDPVDPSIATPRLRRCAAVIAEPARAASVSRSVRHRQREEQRVDPVEHAAVPGNEVRAVLHARLALEHRLHQVADLAGDADDDARTGPRPAAACRAAPAGAARTARTASATSDRERRARPRRPRRSFPGSPTGISLRPPMMPPERRTPPMSVAQVSDERAAPASAVPAAAPIA